MFAQTHPLFFGNVGILLFAVLLIAALLANIISVPIWLVGIGRRLLANQSANISRRD
jgi:hypothetical protein